MSEGKLRKWSDTSAPSLWANISGGLVDLFEAVLVDGYGSQSALGWTKEYTSPDGDSMVFRNNPTTGTGCYLQIRHSSGATGATRTGIVSAYESMTAWDTGLSRMPVSGEALYLNFASSTGTSCTDGIHWMIIGDDRGFWFCCRPYLAAYPDIVSTNNARLWNTYFFGDYIPANYSNSHNFFLMGSIEETAGTHGMDSYDALGAVSTNFWVMRDGTFNIGSQKCGLSSGSPYEEARSGYAGGISPVNNRTLVSPIAIHDSYNYLLGFLPGVRNCIKDRGVFLETATGLSDTDYILSDRTMHELLVQAGSDSYNLPTYLSLISGEGFRDVL